MPDLRTRVQAIIDYTGTDQRLDLVKRELDRALKETAMPETKGLEPELKHDHISETFKYYVSEAQNGWCKIPRRVADDLAVAYERLNFRATTAEASLSAAQAEIAELRGANEAFAALDVADRLIERAYGTDVPKEWNDAYRAVSDARSLIGGNPDAG